MVAKSYPGGPTYTIIFFVIFTQKWQFRLENENFEISQNSVYLILTPNIYLVDSTFFQKTLEVTLPVVVDKTSDSLYIPPMLLPEIKKDIPKGQN